MGWLNTAEIYSLPILKAGSVNSKYWQAHTALKGSEEESFLASSQLLVAPRRSWCSLACSCITAISASVFTYHSSLCVSSVSLHPNLLLLSLIKILLVGFKAHRNPLRPHFNLTISTKMLSLNKVTFTGTRD